MLNSTNPILRTLQILHSLSKRQLSIAELVECGDGWISLIHPEMTRKFLR